MNGDAKNTNYEYAFSKGKKIITIVNSSEEISNTLKGISNSYLIYSNLKDLEKKLAKVL